MGHWPQTQTNSDDNNWGILKKSMSSLQMDGPGGVKLWGMHDHEEEEAMETEEQGSNLGIN